jgi:hypothetical protein
MTTRPTRQFKFITPPDYGLDSTCDVLMDTNQVGVARILDVATRIAEKLKDEQGVPDDDNWCHVGFETKTQLRTAIDNYREFLRKPDVQRYEHSPGASFTPEYVDSMVTKYGWFVKQMFSIAFKHVLIQRPYLTQQPNNCDSPEEMGHMTRLKLTIVIREIVAHMSVKFKARQCR